PGPRVAGPPGVAAPRSPRPGLLPRGGGGPRPASPPPRPGLRDPCKLQSESRGEWGSLTSQVVLTERAPATDWDEPTRGPSWKREDSWKCPVAGPFFVFGQLGANSDEATLTDMKVSGKTGVACRLALFPASELVLRSGPALTYT